MYPCLMHQCLEAHKCTLVILDLLKACAHLLPSKHNGALIHIFSRHIPKSLQSLHCKHLLLEIDVHEGKELQRGLKDVDLWDRDTGSNDEIERLNAASLVHELFLGMSRLLITSVVVDPKAGQSKPGKVVKVIQEKLFVIVSMEAKFHLTIGKIA